MLNPLKDVLTVEMVRSLIAKIKGALATKVSMGDVVSSWQSTPDDAHVPTEKLVKDTLDNLPPGTAVKGDAESEYRTGNVNLTPANIGAATASQGAKADTAVQGVKVNGTELTKDENNKVSIPDGTTTQKGVVQLSNAINSTSTDEAATPKAVKDAYDELNNKIVARAVFLSQAEWAVQSQRPGDPAKVYYVENGTGEDAYTVYVWKESTSEYVEVDESSIDLDGYWHDGPNTTGNGNVVTGITLGNDGVPVLEKGITALTQHQSVTDNNPTLAWGAKSKVGTIGSTDLHVTMPTDAGGWSLASGNGRYMKFASTENPSSGEMRTIDLAVANNVLGMLGLVRIGVSQNQSAVTPTILGANDDFVTMFSTTKPKVLTFKDSSGKFTYVLDSGSYYNTSANYVFYVIGGNAGKWTFFGNTNAVGDSADLNAGTHQSDLDVTFGFDVTAKKSLTADTATNADHATNSDNADYASTAGSADSVPWSGVDDKPSIPTKDSDLTNDRYVRFDANNQGLTDAQKSNARTNIGAGTSNLELGETAFTAAYGNHPHGRLQNDGSLGDENWRVSTADRLVVAKVEFNGKRGYLVPSAITFDSDEDSKALTQSAEWKEFLPPAGNGSSVSVTPDGTSTGADIGNSTTLKAWAQKFKNLVSSLGRAAYKNTPMSGYNASSSEVVMGDDTRLTNERTPSSHASTGTTYGVGTNTNYYGHVKLLNGDLNGKTYADGVAAASAHTHSQYLTSHQSITTGSSNGSIAVSGRDVAVKGLGSLAYKSTIGTGDVSSGTYSISISGTAAKATNDSSGDNIADQFTSARQSISNLSTRIDDVTIRLNSYDRYRGRYSTESVSNTTCKYFRLLTLSNFQMGSGKVTELMMHFRVMYNGLYISNNITNLADVDVEFLFRVSSGTPYPYLSRALVYRKPTDGQFADSKVALHQDNSTTSTFYIGLYIPNKNNNYARVIYDCSQWWCSDGDVSILSTPQWYASVPTTWTQKDSTAFGT